MVGWFHVSPLQLSSHCRLCWSNTTWEVQTGLDLNVNAYTSSLNVSVKADCGQLAVRKDEPGLPTGSFNASVSVGASPRCRVTLSVTAAGAGLNKWSRSSKRRRSTEQSAQAVYLSPRLNYRLFYMCELTSWPDEGWRETGRCWCRSAL